MCVLSEERHRRDHTERNEPFLFFYGLATPRLDGALLLLVLTRPLSVSPRGPAGPRCLSASGHHLGSPVCVLSALWSPGFLCRVFDFGLVAPADSLTVVFPPPPSGEPGPLDLVGLPLTFGAYQGPLGFLSAVGSVCPPPFLRLSPGVDSTTFHPLGRNTLPDPGRTLLLFSLRENSNLRLLPTLLCGSASCVSGLRKLSVVGDWPLGT